MSEQNPRLSDNIAACNVLQPLQRIDFSTGKFEANGKTYYIETDLTVSRFCEHKILEKELAMGVTLDELYQSMTTIKQLLNQVKFVEAAVFVDKIINHCANLKHKEPTILKMCTLFLNTDGEDRAAWNNDMMMRKLQDWKASNIDVNDFFEVALILTPFYTGVYNRLTLNISENMEVVTDLMSATLKSKI